MACPEGKDFFKSFSAKKYLCTIYYTVNSELSNTRGTKKLSSFKAVFFKSILE